MPDSPIHLAVCFFDQRLYYTVAQAGPRLVRIGSQEFSFSIAEAFRNRDTKKLEGVYAAVKALRQEFGVSDLQVITFPAHECWTLMPKIVQDQPDEREAYLAVLMRGVNRQAIETSWHELSNRDFRFLTLRDRRIMGSFERFGEIVPRTAFMSDFETGGTWARSPRAGSSYLTITGHPGCLSVTSYLLGKLRGATFFRFDSYEDLPYLWLQTARHLRWMQGMHEQILVYGLQSAAVRELLAPVLDPAAETLVMDSLSAMGLSADEETYNFDLSQAFPAIMNAIQPCGSSQGN